MDKAIVLLSGGLDSTTCLALARQKKLEVFALSFDYGQKHIVELTAAKSIAKQYGVSKHYIVPIKIPDISTSSLTNKNITIPKDDVENQSVPSTYVPARNTIFLSYALSLAEATKANSIWIGCSSVDYSGYPDCRPEFIQSFNSLANIAIPAGINNKPITIETPLLNLSKAETIKLGLSLNIDYSKTISCYMATQKNNACGHCDSCLLRKKGFQEANIL